MAAGDVSSAGSPTERQAISARIAARAQDAIGATLDDLAAPEQAPRIADDIRHKRVTQPRQAMDKRIGQTDLEADRAIRDRRLDAKPQAIER